MPIIRHDDLPFHQVPRIKTRILVDANLGAAATTIWEQYIHAQGCIPPHYHDVEEVLLILEGVVNVTLHDRTFVVQGGASILIPPHQLHALRPNAESEIHLLAFFPTAAPQIYAADGSLRLMPWEDLSPAETERKVAQRDHEPRD